MASARKYRYFLSWMMIQTILPFSSATYGNSSARKAPAFGDIGSGQRNEDTVVQDNASPEKHQFTSAPLTPSQNDYLKHFYDYQYDCKDFGSTCRSERKKASKYTEEYYNYAHQQEKLRHKDQDGKYYTGVSYVDPRPTGYDRYVDYKTGKTTPTRPPYGHYGVLPYTPVRDPTCKELSNIIRENCETNYNTGICGFGTTWNPNLNQCVKMTDDYMTIYGTGQPYYRPVYPRIRPFGDKTCFDNPDDVYLYVTQEQIHVYDSVHHGTDTCTPTYPYGTCNANRCRFPLTSTQGQNQAKYYVRLFREVYEYSGSDANKQARRTRIRTLIDNHALFFGSTIHNNGAFLPWHRWYILEMETILMQHQSETVTTYGCINKFVGIPYFDWHNLKNGQTLKEFINNANDPIGHHFHDSLGQNTVPSTGCVTAGALSGFLLTGGSCLRRWWSNSVAEEDPEVDLHPLFPLSSNYNQFRNFLEHGPGLHDNVHGIVGGTMGSGGASNDPLFFTHHGNVDKIWGDWQEQSNAHKNAYAGNPLLNDLMPTSTATPANMLDLDHQLYTPPLGSPPVTLSVEYVDFDTSSMWGDGTSSSI